MAQVINPCFHRGSLFCRRWMSPDSRVVILCGFLVVPFIMNGCGRSWELIEIQGTVSQAGQPLAGVRVTFLPDSEVGTKGPRTSGSTDATGHYDLHTDAGNPGAVIGHYRVCLFALPSEDNQDKESKMLKTKGQTNVGSSKPDDGAEKHPALDRVPLKYRFFDKTPLRAEVRPGGPQTINFDIP